MLTFDGTGHWWFLLGDFLPSVLSSFRSRFFRILPRLLARTHALLDSYVRLVSYQRRVFGGYEDGRVQEPFVVIGTGYLTRLLYRSIDLSYTHPTPHPLVETSSAAAVNYHPSPSLYTVYRVTICPGKQRWRLIYI